MMGKFIREIERNNADSMTVCRCVCVCVCMCVTEKLREMSFRNNMK